jgi:hypothetical protein
MSFIVIFATKSIFVVLLPNINNFKKYLRYEVTKHVNSFLVIVLLIKAHK